MFHRQGGVSVWGVCVCTSYVRVEGTATRSFLYIRVPTGKDTEEF